MTRTSDPIKASASYNFSMGPRRPFAPNESIIGTIARAVGDVLGPDATFTITSGQEGANLPQYGSNRHKTGQAADVAIYDASGNRITAYGTPSVMQEIARAAAARGAQGIGFGTDYMGGTHMHIDRVSPGPGQSNTWGNMGRRMRNELVGIMREPIAYLDKIGAIPTPADSGRSIAAETPTIAPPGTMAATVAPAPVQGVQTASLGLLPTELPPSPVASVERGAGLEPPAQPAPVQPVARGLLANVPQEAVAAPVGTVSRGAPLSPALFGGDPNLANAGGFVSPLARDDGRIYIDGEARTGMAQEFPFAPTGQADAAGNMPLLMGSNGIGEAFPAPIDRTYQPVTAPQEGERQQGPTIAAPGTMAPPLSPSPVQSVSRGILADITTPIESAPSPQPTSSSIEQARTSLDVTDQEYAAQLSAAGLSASEIQMALADRIRGATITPAVQPQPQIVPPVQPLAPPVNVKQYTVASPSPVQPQSRTQTPPPPSGMDVWKGESGYGMDTAGGTLWRNGADVYRYSPQYDTTSVYRNGQWLPANNVSPLGDTIGLPFPGIERPSQSRMTNRAKGFAGGAAGGLLASALGLGPVGGFLGAALGRSLAQGEGFAGMFNNGRQMTQPANQIAPDQLAVDARRSALRTNGGAFQPSSQNPSDYSYSPSLHDMAAAGQGGLF